MVEHRIWNKMQRWGGVSMCAEAYAANRIDGYGARSIGQEVLPCRPDGKDYTTQQVDAMIDAYEAYIEDIKPNN